MFLTHYNVVMRSYKDILKYELIVNKSKVFYEDIFAVLGND